MTVKRLLTFAGLIGLMLATGACHYHYSGYGYDGGYGYRGGSGYQGGYYGGRHGYRGRHRGGYH
jgi:hypothetical protein